MPTSLSVRTNRPPSRPQPRPNLSELSGRIPGATPGLPWVRAQIEKAFRCAGIESGPSNQGWRTWRSSCPREWRRLVVADLFSVYTDGRRPPGGKFLLFDRRKSRMRRCHSKRILLSAKMPTGRHYLPRTPFSAKMIRNGNADMTSETTLVLGASGSLLFFDANLSIRMDS